MPPSNIRLIIFSTSRGWIFSRITSGGIMPKNRSMSCLEKSKIPVLITKEDTYKIAARVNSMVVKLKPQDTEKIKIIVDMVEKYVDIDKVLANLK